MGFSVILDVAIGLMLMYLVLSLICTTLVELVLTLGAFRGKNLSAALDAIIDDPTILARFYNDGLIASAKAASRGGAPAAAEQSKRFGAAALVWVWRCFFPGGGDRTVLDVRIKADTARQAVLKADLAAGAAIPETYLSGKPKDRDHPSYLDSAMFAMAIENSLRIAAQGKTAAADVRDAIAKLPENSKLRSVLSASLAAAGDDVDTFRTNVAHWFDATMDRLSGDFARLSKRWSLVIGILIAACANADSLTVATALWSSPALRGQAVDAAVAVVATDYVSAGSCPSKPTQDEKATCEIDQLKKLQTDLAVLPVGWSDDALDAISGWRGWLGKVAGLVFTGLALSLGAPFWFDLLQKAINLRGAGPKPSTQAEKDAAGG